MIVHGDKYLTFVLNEEEYAISIKNIKEILGMMPYTAVPNLPKFMRGLVNLRGKIIPILDLRIKFGLDEKEDDRKTTIIVVEIETAEGYKTKGIIVDEVHEVKEIDQEHIEKTPEFGSKYKRDYFKGVGKIEDRVIMLLDIHKILSLEINK